MFFVCLLLILNLNKNFKTKLFFVSKGFYWDISDWSGGIASIDPNGMQKLNNNQTINTKIPASPQLLKVITTDSSELSTNLDFSPIYSKVFKSSNNKNGISKISELDDDDESKTPINSNSDEEEFSKKDLTSFKPNNYMYLNTDECDQTFESRSNDDNQSNRVKLIKNSESNLTNDEELGFSASRPKTSSTLSVALSKNDNDDDYFMPSLFKSKNTKSKPINL